MDKVLENRLRRVAARRGLTLQKNRLRDTQAIGYGTYRLKDGEPWVPLKAIVERLGLPSVTIPR